MAKFIFVCGGVMSGIGKGIATASIGRILKSRGLKVTAAKIDPYINVDAGTMNPIEHGEVFVTDEGLECDQDIGHYERFLDQDIPRENYMTTGSVYRAVIERERNLEYDGKCVEVIPHIPEEVIRRLEKARKKADADVLLVEIGGTMGDYQNVLFLEAGRMMRFRNPKDVLFVLVTYLPVPEKIGEMKTKPTQHAVRFMNSVGIQPDIIIARASVPLDEPRKRKIGVFCNIHGEDVISAPDVDVTYDVPVNFENDRLSDRILSKFELRSRRRNLAEWKTMTRQIHAAEGAQAVRIGIVGKYFGTGDFTLSDSYISVIEAIKHAAWSLKRRPEITWLDAEAYEKDSGALSELTKYHGIIVPGGFGSRGVEGKIKAIEFCRTQRMPYLGLCYGLQLAVIEFARNVCGLRDAHTTEVMERTPHPVIDTMPDQIVNIQERHLGGTMRLGAYLCRLKRGTQSFKAYGIEDISERHRHRYEVNNEYRARLEERGLIIAGVSAERDLVEVIELKSHPFFVGTQFHPELKSRPNRPHPLYRAFIRAATQQNTTP